MRLLHFEVIVVIEREGNISYLVHIIIIIDDTI